MDQPQDKQQPQQAQSPKQQVVEALKNATNVLVTVSRNPSVDQLAACIGMTLMLNKLDKHATAVFSGEVPSTLEFLQPEKTIETNTDSLRDFIISLDRAKADKLRYKVEDNVVKIFITPYRTSLSGDDLQFSQGDFNVDVVLALGVTDNDHLDEAITSHGRILHDATVIGLSCGQGTSDVGGVNWHEETASSLSEMLVSISESFQSGLLDGQMATSFLTGIVSETERFSNQKTTPKVMTMSAQLMAAGANQQLISSQLAPAPTWQPPVEEQKPEEKPQEEKPVEPYMPPEDVLKDLPVPVDQGSSDSDQQPDQQAPSAEGNQSPDAQESDLVSLQEDVQKAAEEVKAEQKPEEKPKEEQPAGETEEEKEKRLSEIHIDEEGRVHDAQTDADDEYRAKQALKHERVIQPINMKKEESDMPKTDLSSYIFEPPTNGGTFTGSTQDEPEITPENTNMQPANDIPILSHDSGSATTPAETLPPEPDTPPSLPPLPEVPSLPPADPPLNLPAPEPVAPPVEHGPDYVDPLAGMAPPVVGTPEEAPALPDIPPPSTDPVPPPDPDAARQAVLNAMGTEAPLAPSPIAALNAQPISLDAPVPPPSDPSAPTPPPVPPPMMMPPAAGADDLPPPVEEEKKAQEPTNPFNLPPVH